MSLRWVKGVLYGVTAFITGYAVLYQMLQKINGGPWSWWYPISLGSSILLLVGSVHAVAPEVSVGWLIALAAAIPLAICGLFGGLPLRCWVFAVALALAAWVGFIIDSAVRRSDIAAFIASSVLTASWLPLSMNTFRAYLSPNSQVANSPLLPLLSLWTLIIATLVLCGIALFRSSQA